MQTNEAADRDGVGDGSEKGCPLVQIERSESPLV